MLKRITLALTLFVSAGCQSNVKEFQLTPSLTGSPIGPVAAVALKVEFRQTPPREQRKIIRAIYEDMHVQYEKFAQGKLDEIELRRRLRVRLRLLAAIAAQIGEDPESVIKARGLNYTPARR